MGLALVAPPVRQLWHDLPQPGADRVPVATEVQHRLERVLRLGQGARVLLADGQGRRLPAVWRGAEFEAAGDLQTSAPNDTQIVLGAGLLKGERWDWLIEKCTELGVDRLVPLQLDHCVVRIDAERGRDKVERWRAIAIEAFEQCGRAVLPEIPAPLSLAGWLGQERDSLLCFCDERGSAVALGDLVRSQRPRRLAILIGPEGGLSTAERAQLQEARAVGVTLGRDVLRAETAALAALVIARTASEPPPAG